MLIRLNYQVSAENGPLVFPVGRSLLQIFPGSNTVDTEVWNQIKKLPRTQELLQQRLLHSPDFTAIISPPASKPDENKYEVINASIVAASQPTVNANVAVLEKEEIKPTRVASTSSKTSKSDTSALIETAVVPDVKPIEEKKVSKFKAGVSNPGAE